MRYWTAAEADAVLPDVAAKVERVQELLEHHRKVAGNGHGTSAQDQPPADALGEVLAELHRDGITVKDPARGLVDFAARSPSGREYLLCWLVSEPAVTWWHWPEDGFAGRTPISDLPD